MARIDDGGPAFPTSRIEEITPVAGEPFLKEVEHPGMSLRDWFAGQAMTAIVSQAKLNPCGDFVADDSLLQHANAPRRAAATAYAFADAMLAEREKERRNA